MAIGRAFGGPAALCFVNQFVRPNAIALNPGGGVLPYITYIGMCRCEGYGFQAVWSGIGYRNQGVFV